MFDWLDRLRGIKELTAWLPTAVKVVPKVRQLAALVAAGQLDAAENVAVDILTDLGVGKWAVLADRVHDSARAGNWRAFAVANADLLTAVAPYLPDGSAPLSPADGGAVVTFGATLLKPFDAGELERSANVLDDAPLVAGWGDGATPVGFDPMSVIAVLGLVLNVVRFLRERRQVKGADTLAAAFPALAA